MQLILPERGTQHVVDVINRNAVITMMNSTPEIVKFINVITDAVYPTSQDTVLFYAFYNTNQIVACGNGRGTYPQYQVIANCNTLQIGGSFYAWDITANAWVRWTYLTKDDEAIFYAKSTPEIQQFLPVWNDAYLNQTPNFIFYADQTQDCIYVTFDGKVMTVTNCRWCEYNSRLQIFSLDMALWRDADTFFSNTQKATITNLCRNNPTIESFVANSFIPPFEPNLKFYAIKGRSNIIAAQNGETTNIDNCYSCVYTPANTTVKQQFSFDFTLNYWTTKTIEDLAKLNNLDVIGILEPFGKGGTGSNYSYNLSSFTFTPVNTTINPNLKALFCLHSYDALLYVDYAASKQAIIKGISIVRWAKINPTKRHTPYQPLLHFGTSGDANTATAEYAGWCESPFPDNYATITAANDAMTTGDIFIFNDGSGLSSSTQYNRKQNIVDNMLTRQWQDSINGDVISWQYDLGIFTEND